MSSRCPFTSSAPTELRQSRWDRRPGRRGSSTSVANRGEAVAQRRCRAGCHVQQQQLAEPAQPCPPEQPGEVALDRRRQAREVEGDGGLGAELRGARR